MIDIAGDGSIQMNIQELGLPWLYKVPVIVCILNNQYLGMVRQWQEPVLQRRYSYTDISLQPDFVKLAEAYGAVGMRVTEPDQVKDALLEAMKVEDRPVFIDFIVERKPMSTPWWLPENPL